MASWPSSLLARAFNEEGIFVSTETGPQFGSTDLLDRPTAENEMSPNIEEEEDGSSNHDPAEKEPSSSEDEDLLASTESHYVMRDGKLYPQKNEGSRDDETKYDEALELDEDHLGAIQSLNIDEKYTYEVRWEEGDTETTECYTAITYTRIEDSADGEPQFISRSEPVLKEKLIVIEDDAPYEPLQRDLEPAETDFWGEQPDLLDYMDDLAHTLLPDDEPALVFGETVAEITDDPVKARYDAFIESIDPYAASDPTPALPTTELVYFANATEAALTEEPAPDEAAFAYATPPLTSAPLPIAPTPVVSTFGFQPLSSFVEDAPTPITNVDALPEFSTAEEATPPVAPPANPEALIYELAALSGPPVLEYLAIPEIPSHTDEGTTPAAAEKLLPPVFDLDTETPQLISPDAKQREPILPTAPDGGGIIIKAQQGVIRSGEVVQLRQIVEPNRIASETPPASEQVISETRPATETQAATAEGPVVAQENFEAPAAISTEAAITTEIPVVAEAPAIAEAQSETIADENLVANIDTDEEAAVEVDVATTAQVQTTNVSKNQSATARILQTATTAPTETTISNPSEAATVKPAETRGKSVAEKTTTDEQPEELVQISETPQAQAAPRTQAASQAQTLTRPTRQTNSAQTIRPTLQVASVERAATSMPIETTQTADTAKTVAEATEPISPARAEPQTTRDAQPQLTRHARPQTIRTSKPATAPNITETSATQTAEQSSNQTTSAKPARYNPYELATFLATPSAATGSTATANSTVASADDDLNITFDLTERGSRAKRRSRRSRSTTV